MVQFTVMLSCFGFFIVFGIVEKIRNKRNLKRLAIRINVNGIRGKSTVTRLITSFLHEVGISTIGKTTGTAPRIIIPAENIEQPIIRPPQGANIKEQLQTIKKAVSMKAEALVCECMAVRPDYQDVYQNQMFHANITVIVNILEDHLDVMGPTMDEIAIAFSRTIPEKGILVMPPNKYQGYLTQIAESRKSKVVIADERLIPEGYLDNFDYILFPANVSLALAVGEALGIPRATALSGMLKALPDPGALRITQLNSRFWHNSIFVNGFAANEPKSSLLIWDRIRERSNLSYDDTIVLFNGRPDRIDRTIQFVEDFFPLLKGVTLVGMGQCISSMKKGMDDGLFPGVHKYLHLEDCSGSKVADVLRSIMKRSLLIGVGNIHGDAHDLIDILLTPRTSTILSSVPSARRKPAEPELDHFCDQVPPEKIVYYDF
ncbi:MAG: poly-gamma-glutamate synthase PgsB [Peptococcaceae bacterium]|nr:poly-gamma-glutamate synthase PgsB [Peptococcaceae bacterium]